MERTLVSQTVKKVGQEVKLSGWVNRRRDHGKIIFLDLRDRSGLVQLVVGEPLSSDPAVAALRSESVVEVEGLVVERSEKTFNPKLATGKVEVKVSRLKVLALAASLPFDMGGEELNLQLPTLLDFRAYRLLAQSSYYHDSL